MKYAALLMALLSTAAIAEPLVWVPNEAGGKIILTKDDCPLPKIKGRAFFASSNTDEGEVIAGCWAVYKADTSKIVIIWLDSANVRLYPKSDFKLLSQ